MSTRRYDGYENPTGKPEKRGRLRTMLESTVFLAVCIVVAFAALVILLLFPDLLAGIVLIVVIAIAVVAVLAVIASVIMTVVAVPLYLAKGEHMDDLDYDIDDVKDRNSPDDK